MLPSRSVNAFGSWLLGTLLALVVWTPSAAQTPNQQLSSYLGQTVASVDIAGRPDVTFKSVQELIAVKPGQPLSQKDVDASTANLKQQGGFQDVKLDLEPEAGGVGVVFILQPAVYVGMYEFPGALKEFPYSRLLQVANYNSQMPYSASDVRQAENALVKFFRQHGYFLAEVRPQIEPESDFGLANIVFHTTLGVRAKIGTISLAGANPEETNYLQRKLRSVMARLRGDSLKPGMKYSYNRLQGATRYLQSALASQSYITGEVKLVSAEYDSNTNRADIVFQVTTGPVVKVTTTGAHVWKRTVRNLVPMYQVNAVNDELIKEGQRNLVSYFQAKGYFDTTVDVKTTQNEGGMSIVYDIHKDGRHKVDEVAFKGNHHFSGKELQSHVSVEEGTPDLTWQVQRCLGAQQREKSEGHLSRSRI